MSSGKVKGLEWRKDPQPRLGLGCPSLGLSRLGGGVSGCDAAAASAGRGEPHAGGSSGDQNGFLVPVVCFHGLCLLIRGIGMSGLRRKYLAGRMNTALRTGG